MLEMSSQIDGSNTFLYSKQNTVTDAALKHMECLPMMDDLDRQPTIEELSNAITEMTYWKASRSDGILANLLRQCKSCL